jgi:hypothetical protein
LRDKEQFQGRDQEPEPQACVALPKPTIERQLAKRPSLGLFADEMSNFFSSNSINKTSIISWFNVPKRVMARMSLIYFHSERAINLSVSQEQPLAEHRFEREFEQELTAPPGLPSSFSFVTSNYALGLFITVRHNFPQLISWLICFVVGFATK